MKIRLVHRFRLKAYFFPLSRPFEVMKMLSYPRLILSLVFTVLIWLPVFAQRERDTWTGASSSSLEVSGQVRLVETGQPARNVPIRLERFGGGIIDQINTDNGGRFRFPNLQRGYYKVVVNAPGYNPAQQDADLQVLFRAFLVFELTADPSKTAAGAASLTDIVDARVPPNARDEFTRGRAALAKRNEQEAIAHFERALVFYPEFFEAQLLLGTAFMDTRQWEKAERVLSRALVVKPDDASVLLSLGEVYWRQKRYDEAEKILQDGIKLDDKSWHGYFTLGRLYWDKGDIAKAGPPIGKTLQLKPDFAEAHLLAGNILLRVAQQERALVEYQEYLRLAPRGEFAGQARDLTEKLKASLASGKKN
ncbi:MAG TPA: tetratricopeptide repeat protein [Pyrinomonadaceae bacterium]